MTPSDVRRKIEALSRQRDILLGTVAEAERRANALANVYGKSAGVLPR